MPSPQQHYAQATAKALAQLRRQPAEQLTWLGARQQGKFWLLHVLEQDLSCDLTDGGVHRTDGTPVQPAWQILMLHYLTVADRPRSGAIKMTFADLPDGRVYAKVYQGRVISRLCSTAGRDRQTLSTAAKSLGARPAEGGDVAFDLTIFPRITMRLIWHAGDEEFSPSATLLLPENIKAFLSTEDVVVLSESVVRRLTGRDF